MAIEETWYLLYEGTSVDGSGSAPYHSRTTVKEVAKWFWEKERRNPYSTSRVVVITDTKEQRIVYGSQWDQYD